MIPFQPANFILASNSPRRRMLLQEAGYKFVVSPADESVELAVPIPDNPADLPLQLARAKANAVASQFLSGTVLAADTIAICDSEILGKPGDKAEARRMLQMLAGREHLVLTGLCLIDCESRRTLEHLETTALRMDSLTPQQIDDYLATEKWKGKAGAFGYQDGWDWLHVIQGSETNVVGLPIERLPELLQTLIGSRSKPNG